MATTDYYHLIALRTILERRQAQRIAKGNPSDSLARAIAHIKAQLTEAA
jgi:hypothetical protein